MRRGRSAGQRANDGLPPESRVQARGACCADTLSPAAPRESEWQREQGIPPSAMPHGVKDVCRWKLGLVAQSDSLDPEGLTRQKGENL